jgi:peptide/nickel transport system permease protein
MNKIKEIIKKLWQNKKTRFGLIVFSFYLIIAIIAPIIAPPYRENDPYIVKQTGFSAIPQKPSLKSPFGTTQNQYDIFYALVWGTRMIFKITAKVIIISLLIGIILGGVSGYFGGIIDEIIMRFTDIILSIPSLILAIFVIAILGPGIEKVVIAISFVWWPGYARIFRSEILKIKSMDFIKYSQMIGAKTFWIFKKHIIPNAIYNVIILASLDISNIVIIASSLSFLGLGSPPGYSDWGQIISVSRNWIISGLSSIEYSHTLVIPSLFIFFFVFSLNIISETLRDIFDPKLN